MTELTLPRTYGVMTEVTPANDTSDRDVQGTALEAPRSLWNSSPLKSRDGTGETVEKAPASEARSPAELDSTLDNIGPRAEHLIRVHVIDQLLVDLQKIQAVATTPASAPFAGRIIKKIQFLRDQSPADPCLGALLALHDALAVRNMWCEYTAEQYMGAHEIVRQLSKETVRENLVEKMITKLEQIGFDISPFAIDPTLDWDED